ncbi:hypothetical protein [Vallicoccus soli]|uniref:Uncharacterized protein n=1 Tax=Vallicoccus soli TaxID=2339232 RepID=A0A3A3YYP5_9ACTN|nr:hypothetical protein [Vallicoccus soli]RJK96860.1 hypothetical protein D5H78_06255 [Vallicoccus soli]
MGTRRTPEVEAWLAEHAGELVGPVRLMVDHGVDWPVWTDAGALPAGEPPVSPGLHAELVAWCELFARGNARPEEGWAGADVRRAFVRQGRGLQRRLSAELDLDVQLRV